MDLLWVVAVVALVALGLLFAFAARIDPLSGRWKARTAKPRKDNLGNLDIDELADA